MRVAQRTFIARFEQVRGRLKTTSTLEQDRATLGDFGKATTGFVAALRRVTPPAEVREEHGRFVAAVVAFERRIKDAAKRLGGGSAQDRAGVRTELSSGVERTQAQIAKAVGEINRGLRD